MALCPSQPDRCSFQIPLLGFTAPTRYCRKMHLLVMAAYLRAAVSQRCINQSCSGSFLKCHSRRGPAITLR